MGLIGIAAAFAWRTGQKGIARSLAINVGFVLVLGYFLNLDNAAHLGGFVAGALIGLAARALAAAPAALARRHAARRVGSRSRSRRSSSFAPITA